jgi:hypothetical protein
VPGAIARGRSDDAGRLERALLMPVAGVREVDPTRPVIAGGAGAAPSRPLRTTSGRPGGTRSSSVPLLHP